MSKKLRIALQMDPLQGININGDSTFVLGLGAQELGHTLYSYHPKDMHWQNGQVVARAQEVALRREAGNHFTIIGDKRLNLSTDVDVILLRQDPPFDMGYITNTHLLDQIVGPRIINNPTGVRNAPEKLLMLRWPNLLPPTLIAYDGRDITEFTKQHGTVVAKKLYGNAGRDVFRFALNELDELLTLAKEHLEKTGEPMLLQPFLPEISNGDKRIILFDGKPVGVMQRMPKEGEFRANLALGASAHKCELTQRDRDICSIIAPTLREMGLYFAGIDVIGDYLIEINVTSPTGLQGINNLYDLKGDARMEMLFWRGLS
ncbi:MAG: glutathione synthase [Alphaproteobacteria bacterium]|nr:glutathione synthase [Alphaproteobacteria bacterium]